VAHAKDAKDAKGRAIGPEDDREDEKGCFRAKIVNHFWGRGGFDNGLAPGDN
jgi:hypothetical protein